MYNHKLTCAFRIVLLSALITLYVAVVLFCCFYLISSYNQLVAWYLNLNDCFYRVQEWSSTVFTPEIKSAGNAYCVIALIISLCGSIYSIKKLKRQTPQESIYSFHFSRYDTFLLICCIAVSLLLGLWGNHMERPGFDEVFSAQNVAGIHPFQSISYYMLPNNHILFNLLNNLFFHTAQNKIFTGRIISLIAYCSVTVVIFLWFRQILHNRWFAAIISIVAAMQFFTWGFGFQARGYELYLLCEWGAFISLLLYVQSDSKQWLYINSLCCIAGYYCIPTFLYMHLAQILFYVAYQLFYKKGGWVFWRLQLIVITTVFLLYLPALCFSGTKMLTANKYISPATNMTMHEYCHMLIYQLRPYYLRHALSDLRLHGHSLNLIFLLVPVLLLADRKDKTSRLYGMFWFFMWLSLGLIVLMMKHAPFERNLIGHYSITFAGTLLLVYKLPGFKSRKTKNIPRLVLFPLFVACLAIHFFHHNPIMLRDGLYECNENDQYNELKKGLSFIPQGSTVGFSDESFYCYYLCKEKGCIVNKCSNGNEDYYINSSADEKSAAPIAGKYMLVNTVSDYSIYKKAEKNGTK